MGAVLYCLLTGSPPFAGATPLEILRRVLEEEAARPGTVNPAVDADLDTVCLKCLEKDPQRRYGSAEALAEDLDRWLRREPIQARPTRTWEQAVKWARRKPAIALLAAAIALVALAGLGGILWQWRQAETARRLAEA